MGQPASEELAQTFAEIARQLQAEETAERTLRRVCTAAVQTVPGCDHAGITLIRHGKVETPAASDDVPVAVDAIQYEAGEGPCLEAIKEQEIFLTAHLAVEDRWPTFSRRAADETGVHSMLSFRLFVEEDTLGALNLYSRPTLPHLTVTWSGSQPGSEPRFPTAYPAVDDDAVRALLDSLGAVDTVE